MPESVTAYVGLGANLGDPAQSVRDAILRIGQIPQTSVRRQSKLYRSAPIDADGPYYVNAVVEVATLLGAAELLQQLHRIEDEAGRERPFRNAPRTLDLDLLLYGSATIRGEHLQVPHPRMYERAFVLVPLADIAPDRVTAEQLAAVADQELSPI